MSENEQTIKLFKDIQAYKLNEIHNFKNNKLLSQIESDILGLYEKNNFDLKHNKEIEATINGTTVEFKPSTYSKILAKKIFDEKQRRLELEQKQKNSRKNVLDQQNTNEDETLKNNQNHAKKKPNFSFNLVSIGEMNIEDIEAFFTEKLLKQGYTQEELNSSKDFNILDFNDKAMDLGVDTNATMVEQLAEATQKLYAVLVNGMSPDDAKNLNPHDVKNEATETNLDLPGNKHDVIKTVYRDDTPEEINTSFSTTNGLDIENTPDNDLTEEDLYEIEQYGIEGIGTHAEMEEFRQSEEYELIQKTQQNALSKNNNQD